MGPNSRVVMSWISLVGAIALLGALGLPHPASPPTSSPPTPAAAGPGKRARITKRGRNLDVELQAVDVRSVFPTLGELGRVNFVLEADVAGTVTAYLEDVTWEEATYWICRAMRFRCERSGNVIYVRRSK